MGVCVCVLAVFNHFIFTQILFALHRLSLFRFTKFSMNDGNT